MPSKQNAAIKQTDTFFDVLVNEFKLIGKTWDAFLLNVGTYVMVYILPALAFSIGALILIPMVQSAPDNGINAITVIAAVIAALGLAAVATLVTIASVITQFASAKGKKISYKDAYAKSLPFFWRFIGLGLASALLIVLGFVLLIIPGFLAIFFLTFAAYYMVDKNVSITDSIKGSYELSKKNWKIVLAFLVLQGIIEFPSIVPVFGTFVTMCLAIAYFTLPAFLYGFMTKTK